MPNESLVYLQDSLVRCLDKLGNLNWEYNVVDSLNAVETVEIQKNPAGEAVSLIRMDTAHYRLLTFSYQGALLTNESIDGNMGVVLKFVTLDNGTSLLLQASNSIPGRFLTKVDATGDTLWTSTIPNYWFNSTWFFNDFTPTHDQGVLLVGLESDSITGFNHTLFLKLDSTGQWEWHKSIPLTPGNYGAGWAVIQAPDSSFMAFIHDIVPGGPSQDYRLLKIDQDGDSLDVIPTPALNGEAKLQLTPDGNFVLYYAGWTTGGGANYLHKYDWAGNLLWTSIHATPYLNQYLRMTPLQDSGFAVVGSAFDPLGLVFPSIYVARSGPSGLPIDNLVTGGGFYDLNNNCQQDTNEPHVPNLILEVSGDSSFIFSANSAGEVHLPIPAGAYQIGVSTTNPIWALSSCSQPANINFSGIDDTASVSFPLVPIALCPSMQVDISTWALPICRESIFSVSYSNNGSDTAFNAYIDVTLPQNVSLDSATLPAVLQSNGDYRFDLGTVPMLSGGQILIYVSIACPPNPLDLFDVTECAVARIYPDTSCLLPSPAWDSSNVSLDVRCDAPDSVRFRIHNNSSYAMTNPGVYLVLEDNIMRANNSFQLAANDSLVFSRTANGATWTLMADQSPGHPSSTQPLISLEGCGTDSSGNVSLGVISMMPQDDNDPTVSIFCSPYVAAYDPNDKLAFPEGLGDEHEIEEDVQIDYMIRFQNTGTFFAEDVFILDTIEAGLDLSQLLVTGASHDYEWEILPNRVLRFLFEGIMLPDSNMNEPESHGFVKFSIRPDADVVQPGSRIENRAAIYFDFNPPIITNTAFHTIASEMFGLVSVDEVVGNQGLSLQTYPNPFQEEVNFLLTEPMDMNSLMKIYTPQGQLVRTVRPGRVQQFTFRQGDLPAGLYIFRLEDGNGKAATGKLLIR